MKGVIAIFLFLLMFQTLKQFIPAITWFVFVTVLFLIPGSEFPNEDWFEKVYLDKVVHIAFIFLLVYLFYFPSRKTDSNPLLLLACLGIVYGIVIEFIQKYLVTGRSFELADIACDFAGCIIAYFIGTWQRKYQKK
jgi:VanZ family protein